MSGLTLNDAHQQSTHSEHYFVTPWRVGAHLLDLVAPVALAYALLSPMFVLIDWGLHESSMWSGLPVGSGLLAAAVATVLLSQCMRPWFSTALVGRFQGRELSQELVPESIHGLQFQIRCVLAVLGAAQLANEIFTGWMAHSAEAAAAGGLSLNAAVAAVALLLLAGAATLLSGQRLFLNTRGRGLINWLSHHQGSVAIEDVIPEWDHPKKAIFENCLASSRIANAYRAVHLSAAGFFAAAGCLAANVATVTWTGEVLIFGCIAATFGLWPVPTRIVSWAKGMTRVVWGDEED